MRPRTGFRLAPFVGAVVVAAFVAGIAGHGAAGSSPSFGSFSVSARADLFLLEVFEDRAPLIPPGQSTVELSPATAHAAVDSLGTSSAFASAPYPGETVVGLPGLLAGLGGGDVPPLPAYPVYVATSHPTVAEDSVDQGVFQLRSSSSSTTSASQAMFGGGEGDAFGVVTGRARSTVEVDGDRVSGVATARVTGLAIPGVVDLANVESRASVIVEPGVDPVVDTSFSVGVLAVGGLELRIGPDGIDIAGLVLPVDLGVVEALLAAVGVDIEFIPAETGSTQDGAVFARSAGLRVETTQHGPDGESTRAVFELGRTFAAADARPAQQIVPGPVVDIEPTPAPVTPAPSASEPPTPPPTPPETIVPSPAPEEVAAPPPPAIPASSGPFDPGPTLTVVYVALVVAGALSLASGRLLGLLGVRLASGAGPAKP